MEKPQSSLDKKGLVIVSELRLYATSQSLLENKCKWVQVSTSELSDIRVRLFEIKCEQLRLHGIKVDQVRSSEIQWDPVRSSEVRWDQER